jgi:hypothetical protein
MKKRKKRWRASFYAVAEMMDCDFKVRNLEEYPATCQKCFFGKVKEYEKHGLKNNKYQKEES